MQYQDQRENQELNLQTKTVEHQNNITFVQEVERYPCLYNYMVSDYNRKDAMDAAWVEIGTKFGISGLECKEKWKNIRSVFVRHLKPLHTRSGRQPRKPYYLSEYLQFAVPFFKSTRPPNSKDDDEETSRDSPYLAKTYPQQFFGNNETELQSPKSEPIEVGIDSQSFTEVQAWASESMKRPNETMEDDALNFLQIKDERSENHSNKMFLLSLLPDLCSMDDKQKRFFKRKVLELIDNILDEEKFPSKPDVKEKWIGAVGRGPVWWPSRSSTICSVHFKEKQFQVLPKKRRLFDWAVPTLKLPVNPTTISSTSRDKPTKPDDSIMKVEWKEVDSKNIVKEVIYFDKTSNTNEQRNVDQTYKQNAKKQATATESGAFEDDDSQMDPLNSKKQEIAMQDEAESLQKMRIQIQRYKAALIQKNKKIRTLRRKTQRYRDTIAKLKEELQKSPENNVLERKIVPKKKNVLETSS